MKKIVGVKPGGDFAGRFEAWWHGRDYVPPEPAVNGAETGRASGAQDPKNPDSPSAATSKGKDASSPALLRPAEEAVASKDAGAIARIKALETLWGEGRLSPGSDELDAQLLDAVLETADRPGGIGFIGVDAALLRAFANRSDRSAHAIEWRSGCLARLRDLAPNVIVEPSEIDRPKNFGEASLEGVLSCEAFAYADHKNGLVARIHRALGETGRWAFLDTTRTTAKTPPEAFASAWAEPQLASAHDIEEMLKLAGFGSVRKIPMTETVLAAARLGYAELSEKLEAAASGGAGAGAGEGALFLQELAWEAQSWRARMRALEGGALEINLWIADKQALMDETQEAASDEVLDAAVQPDDAGAAEALFEKDGDKPAQ